MAFFVFSPHPFCYSVYAAFGNKGLSWSQCAQSNQMSDCRDLSAVSGRRPLKILEAHQCISLTAANLAAARELGLNVSAISDAAVAEAVRAARAEAWAAENAAAISERRTWIEANGTPLADLQVSKIS